MVIKVGHRGAAGYAPENTILSFEKAISLGADMIELDVHICKSGEIIVMHDTSVDRTTDGSGKVGSLTLDDIKILDAGNSQRIPTLDESLNAIQRRAKVNIELKGRSTGLKVAEAIKRFVRSGWDHDDFLVSSKHKNELLDFRKKDFSTRIALITRSGVIPPELENKLYSVHLPWMRITKSKVSGYHKRGIKVGTYTPNNCKIIKFIKDKGVDLIFSDYPDRI